MVFKFKEKTWESEDTALSVIVERTGVTSLYPFCVEDGVDDKHLLLSSTEAKELLRLLKKALKYDQKQLDAYHDSQK